MERWACVDVPALPLQILLLREPGWAGAAAAVVEVDKPQARILQVNAAARRRRVRPGQRYAEALSIEPGLRAGVVDRELLAAAVERLVQRLRAFSPEVEPSEEEPGVLWLDASGVVGPFPSLEEWARRLLANLREAGLHASVAVGFERFASYALARQGRGALVAASRDEERRLSDRVPLDLLRIEPKLRAALDRLGVEDVGGLRRLPDGGLLERFGDAGRRLQRFVRGGGAADLLCGRPAVEPVEERLELDPDETPLDRDSLLFLIKSRLGRLCAELARRGEAVRALGLRLVIEDAAPHGEAIRPAEPTLDEVQLIDLVRLRLEGLALAAPVVGFVLRAEGVRATRTQLELFAERPRRDLAAANRALARLRAEHGDAAVVRAVLREGHLPEGTFAWAPLARLEAAHPADVPRGRLVRRLLARPHELDRDRREPDGWCAAGLACGPVRRTFGPYVVSGGWWRRRGEEHRAYHLAETSRGDVLWVYYDRRRRRWFWHGVVD